MRRTIDEGTYLKVIKKTEFRCGYCGVPLDDKSATIDHKHPRALGGSGEIENLVVACRQCNGQKRHKTVDEFRDFIFDSIAAGLHKTLDYLAKTERFIGDNDILEIEQGVAGLGLLLERKRQSQSIEFYFERLERLRASPERKTNNITVEALQ